MHPSTIPIGVAVHTSTARPRLTSTVVPDEQRMAFLPKHFGNDMLVGEHLIFESMRLICPSYTGGYWDFIEVSNGAFYMRLRTDGLLRISLPSCNGYYGEMSADAASITATLFAINRMVWNGCEELGDAYYILRAYAAEHPERSEILGAID